MNNFAISNLANMERQLYGYNAGRYMNCPSMYNGYLGTSANYMNYYNPAFRGYGNYNQDIFTQAGVNQNDGTKVNNPYKNVQNAYQGNSQVDWSNPQFKGLSEDLNEVADYYVKNSAPSESFMGAAVGGAAFGLMNNMRLIAHPWNSLRHALKPTAEMFKGIGVEGSKLRALWQNPETTRVVMEAYGQMHKLHGATHSKLGLFKARLEGESLTKAENIIARMKSALSEGNAQKIAELSEEARRLTNAKTGYVPRAWRWLGLNKPYQWLKETSFAKSLGIGAAKPTVAEAAAKSVSEKAAASTLSGALKHSCGVGNGLMFAGFEFLSDFVFERKIQAAFEKDNATGIKQLTQTGIKGIGSAVGWAVGEGIGTWAGTLAAAKIGALAGSAVAPGVGTAIGAIAGLVGGSIGCWLTGKITHKIIGQEAGTVAKAEKMKQTAQGQQELLQLTLPQAMEDKKLSQRTAQALNNVASFYGVGA